nr:hypothetical protein pPsy0462c_00026 [Pseudomonas syringae]
MGKMFFNILATFAEFEADLIRLRTREGMAIARAKGKLRGKQPKLSIKQQKELCRMHSDGTYPSATWLNYFRFRARLSTERLRVSQKANRRWKPSLGLNSVGCPTGSRSPNSLLRRTAPACRHSHVMWVEADVIGLFSLNLGSFSRNGARARRYSILS